MINLENEYKKYGNLKAEILASGIDFDEQFLNAYSLRDDFIEKRRAYGNSDQKEFSMHMKVPQEIILPGGFVVAVNQRNNAIWKLIHENDEFYVSNNKVSIPISFPKRPHFYNEKLKDETDVSKLVTLYGNATLGIFSPGHCYYWNTGNECKFCSLAPTRDEQSDHVMFVKPERAREAIEIALDKEGNRIKHVLVNGGTISNYDLGFEKHLQVLESISEINLPSDVQKHLISMPPKDFKLFERLAAIKATIAMDIEIFNSELFDDICPGKSKEYGRDNFMNAFKEAVSYLGKGNVYCGFVAGLEPVESLVEGMYYVASLGVVPAVNIFHNDPNSQFANHERPSLEFIKEVGHHMSIIYRDNNFSPFIKDTGRNSLDTEAFLQCFI